MKKWKAILAVGVVILACVGCGGQETQNAKSQEIQTESGQTDDKQTENEQAGNGQAEGTPADEQFENGQSESEVNEKNDNYDDLEAKGANGEIEEFAGQIQKAVVNKNMDALADLCVYPLAVNDEVIDSEDAFMELGSDVIFTVERCAVIEAVDVSMLEETMAGVIMGDDVPNIIFKSVNGELGITGIN